MHRTVLVMATLLLLASFAAQAERVVINDSTRHHVYSFSAIARFEYMPTVRFVLALLPDPRGAMDREHIGY